MKRNFVALLLLLAFIISAVSLAFADTRRAQTAPLAAQLPVSDAVVIIDMERLTTDALPQLLSGNIQILNEFNTQIEQVKAQIGIDLRQFEKVAVGMTIKQDASGNFDFEPVVLARGKINPGILLAAARLAAKDKFREEKAGAKTLYLFSIKEILLANKPAAKTPKDDEDFNRMLARVPSEIAATSLDENTLVIGYPARVRETVEGKSRVSANLLSLANRQPNSIISFGANVPAGMSRIWKMEGDDLGKIIDSIRQLAGAVNMMSGNATVSLTGKTAQAAEAKTLHETLEGFRDLGIGLLGGMKGEDKKVYVRLAQDSKITLAGNEVNLSLQISQNDINVLLGKK